MFCIVIVTPLCPVLVSGLGTKDGMSYVTGNRWLLRIVP